MLAVLEVLLTEVGIKVLAGGCGAARADSAATPQTRLMTKAGVMPMMSGCGTEEGTFVVMEWSAEIGIKAHGPGQIEVGSGQVGSGLGGAILVIGLVATAIGLMLATSPTLRQAVLEH